MRRMSGLVRVNDDEWYTSSKTATMLAEWLRDKANLPLSTPILCPADLLPDGTESEIPKALRSVGFSKVRVTRDLPVSRLFADWKQTVDSFRGEVVVTNPPFSLLSPFREWLDESGARYCCLSRPGGLRGWTIPELKDKFCSTDGRRVAAAWFQNIKPTAVMPPVELAIGNCATCHRKKCPVNRNTADWKPGQERPLFGWCIAVKHGIAGKSCNEYTDAQGKKAFRRFFM